MPTPDGARTGSARRPRPKPERRIGWLVRPAEGGDAGVLRITVGKQTTEYVVRELRTDFGRGFELVKVGPDPELYHVLLDQEEGRHSCECQGFLRWSRCKHLAGLLALAAQGRLTTRPAA